MQEVKRIGLRIEWINGTQSWGCFFFALQHGIRNGIVLEVLSFPATDLIFRFAGGKPVGEIRVTLPDVKNNFRNAISIISKKLSATKY